MASQGHAILAQNSGLHEPPVSVDASQLSGEKTVPSRAWIEAGEACGWSSVLCLSGSGGSSSYSPPRPGKWIFSPCTCTVFCLGLCLPLARETEVYGRVTTYLKIDLSWHVCSTEYLICARHSRKWFTCIILSGLHLNEEIIIFISSTRKPRLIACPRLHFWQIASMAETRFEPRSVWVLGQSTCLLLREDEQRAEMGHVLEVSSTVTLWEKMVWTEQGKIVQSLHRLGCILRGFPAILFPFQTMGVE